MTTHTADELVRRYNELVNSLSPTQVVYSESLTLIGDAIAALREREKDAARYRWLRDNCKHSVMFPVNDPEDGERIVHYSQIPEATDASIDAALAQQKKSER